MDLKLGCFALIEPFASFGAQLRNIHALGFTFADLTDNHDGASLGAEFDFSASVSLDAHPRSIRALAAETGIEFTSFCAHANLLDPASPSTYGTAQIIKAIRLAHLLGIKHVITTEGEPKTAFGHRLNPEQRIFSIVEKLQSPIEWAEELGIELLLEPHGIVTASPHTMAQLLQELGHEQAIGICLDTGNSWLGGHNPVEFVRRFASRIKHVHWKDLGPEWLPRRGQIFGCGMGNVAAGDGLVGLEEIAAELRKAAFNGATTLEITGAENVRRSAERLRRWFSGLPAPVNSYDSRNLAGSRT